MNQYQKVNVKCSKLLIKLLATKGIFISFRYARLIIRNPKRAKF